MAKDLREVIIVAGVLVAALILSAYYTTQGNSANQTSISTRSTLTTSYQITQHGIPGGVGPSGGGAGGQGDPATSCPPNQYGQNESSSGSFGCSQIQYSQLGSYPSPCSPGQFVNTLSTGACGTPSGGSSCSPAANLSANCVTPYLYVVNDTCGLGTCPQVVNGSCPQPCDTGIITAYPTIAGLPIINGYDCGIVLSEMVNILHSHSIENGGIFLKSGDYYCNDQVNLQYSFSLVGETSSPDAGWSSLLDWGLGHNSSFSYAVEDAGAISNLGFDFNNTNGITEDDGSQTLNNILIRCVSHACPIGLFAASNTGIYNVQLLFTFSSYGIEIAGSGVQLSNTYAQGSRNSIEIDSSGSDNIISSCNNCYIVLNSSATNNFINGCTSSSSCTIDDLSGERTNTACPPIGDLTCGTPSSSNYDYIVFSVLSECSVLSNCTMIAEPNPADPSYSGLPTFTGKDATILVDDIEGVGHSGFSSIFFTTGSYAFLTPLNTTNGNEFLHFMGSGINNVYLYWYPDVILPYAIGGLGATELSDLTFLTNNVTTMVEDCNECLFNNVIFAGQGSDHPTNGLIFNEGSSNVISNSQFFNINTYAVKITNISQYNQLDNVRADAKIDLNQSFTSITNLVTAYSVPLELGPDATQNTVTGVTGSTTGFHYTVDLDSGAVDNRLDLSSLAVIGDNSGEVNYIETAQVGNVACPTPSGLTYTNTIGDKLTVQINIGAVATSITRDGSSYAGSLTTADVTIAGWNEGETFTLSQATGVTVSCWYD